MGKTQIDGHESHTGDAPKEELPSAHDEPDALQAEGGVGKKQQRCDEAGNVTSHRYGLCYMNQLMEGKGDKEG